MASFFKRSNILVISVLVGLLVFWELAVYFAGIPSYVLPPPHQVLQALFADLPVLLEHSSVTLAESILGMSISTFLAIFIALFMDLNKSLRQTIHSLLVITQTIPSLVLAPLLMIWLGFGMKAKIVVVVLMCFYPITISFFEGLQSLDEEALALLKSFDASTVQIYRKAKIPNALPALFSGLRVAATYSISAAVIAEWLASKAGLGYYMIRVSKAYQLDKVFASLIMIIFWSLMMNGAVALLRSFFLPGKGFLARYKQKNERNRLQL